MWNILVDLAKHHLIFSKGFGMARAVCPPPRRLNTFLEKRSPLQTS